MLELMAIALLSVGSLLPLEPQARQKPAEAVPAGQAAAPAVKPAEPARQAPAPVSVSVPVDAPSEAVAPKKPAPRIEKRAKRALKAKGEAEVRHDVKAGEEEKEPVTPAAEAPTEDQQHAAAPSLAPGAICEELRRAARDRREDRSKLTQEREALAKERARIEALAEEIAQARTALKQETARLQAMIDKINDKAKGPATGKPTAAGSGGSTTLADAGRK